MPIIAFSNPAQRLHDLLERHRVSVIAHGNAGYDAVWSETLNIERSEVTSAIAGAFGLITEIDAALVVTDDQYMRRIVNRYRDGWAKAFIPPNTGRVQAVKEGPSDESIDALGSVASHLRHSMPEGAIPDVESSHGLRDQVNELICEVREDKTLSPEIQEALISRLYDMAWALDRIEIGGAGAIRAALERLLLVYLTTQEQAAEGQSKSSEHVKPSVRLRIMNICLAANLLISAPGAWQSTADLAIEAIKSAPHLSVSINAITGD